ncbi:TonB-dependent receptor family protein [Xanthomonas hortorum]|uniref:TonB-dependent receptor n=1 Tax=Xanthomonas hortorum pv. hederae TaxID=453603 RepID=A0A9X3YZH1_9XANT|nr:TonB-dependent receptor [Xanthomonas hortorum]MCE4369623.1 TonB-dependent receptor [Xanthomonas hortorum pv. hederae]MDC8637121.1 TonB-dependent receptor [Xanthomonas hortorum pv. hederae]PPU86291.1 TonB-dependent receptor [Xanthomonas hortorum pv. hederae]PUF01279.1 TonB-dependent receptor [Xanthomonas hortorum pv. hederae]
MRNAIKRGALLLGAFVPAAAASAGEEALDAVVLDRVRVVATRLQQVPEFDAPASSSLVAVDGRAPSHGVNVSDLLGGVPGLLARDRQNYAQDTQISLRGFGARSTFGVRGLRLYADGIPATMPDGQGQVSHFALAAAERIEVLRGPFSALHGNSSGGVLQIFSADGEAPDRGHVQASAGRDDSRSLGASVRGANGDFGYALAGNVFDTDGWRDHSAAERASLNAKLYYDLAGGGRVQLVANHLDAPDAQDPLGLTWAQVQDDPRQATAVAEQFNTRKSARQDQLGVSFEQPLRGGHGLRAMAYAGQREVEQYLALPVGAQANPLNSGGVIDLDNDYGGADLRWSWRGRLGGRDVEFTAGTNFDRQRQHRRGYENFIGSELGVRGQLRRDERNTVENLDQYAQAWWRMAPRWSLLAGVRHSEVRFASRDAYVVAGNPDDSGRVEYTRTTPVAGLAFAPRDDLRLHVSAGRGFETPTFNELGYRADGGAGLAFDLKPAVSQNIELGGRWRNAGGAALQAALFRADTDDELAVARNVGGRSSFRNVGRARREGVELAAALPLGEQWRVDFTYTWLDASFRDSFPICTGAGCTDPSTLVTAGARIPGTVRQQASLRLGWEHGPWRAALETLGIGATPVNDTGSESAPGYGLLNVEVAREWRIGAQRLRGFARIDNLLDKDHIGSVIVNEGNGRYYEPGPGRGALFGLRWEWGGGP